MASISSTSFDSYNTELQGAALKATRSVMYLPSDLAFHRSLDSDLASDLDAFSARVLSVTNKILALADTARGKGKERETLQSQDDVVDSFHSLVVDAMDQLLERTDISLDEYLGRTKAPAIVVNPPKQLKTSTPQGRLDPALQHASHLPKPQLQFKRRVDNTDTPWYPTLTHKYNAQVPLGYDYQAETDGDPESNYNDGESIPTPLPLRNHKSFLPAHMFAPASPITPSSLEGAAATWVDTPSALRAMINVLRRAREIAVDLEHHDYRSYSGFVCLMQVSTREQDWIVDCLALREELGEVNEVFTDPRIVKVLHGAESDIVWLQQDFSVYIVNLFDTFHASKVLEFPRHGLAHLLEMYCDFTPDKRYQLADWRIRPLPEEMLRYARSDTHFLLFIYDNLRNALLDRGKFSTSTPSTPPDTSVAPSTDNTTLIREVLARSAETGLRTYTKEAVGNGWDALARRWNKIVLLGAGVSGAVFRAAYAWRDKVAREEDESTRYVLPNHHLFALAERPPADMAALLRVFTKVPPTVRRHAGDLLEAVRSAVREAMGEGAGTVEVERTSVLVNREESKLSGGGLSKQNAEDVPMEVSNEETNKAEEKLWSGASRTGSSVSKTSSLFGSTLSSVGTTPPLYTAPQSALFGGMPPVTQASLSRSDDSLFRSVVARIHGSLVIAPTMPKIVKEVISANTTMNTTDTATTTTATAVEVDASQSEGPETVSHAQRYTDVIGDSIVVVGQRQKKRKRTKTGAAEGGVSAKNGEEDSEAGSKEKVFDFATVPNILDDISPSAHVPEGVQRKKRRKEKKEKGSTLERGDFPAPPKAHREVKQGNQSQTFK